MLVKGKYVWEPVNLVQCESYWRSTDCALCFLEVFFIKIACLLLNSHVCFIVSGLVIPERFLDGLVGDLCPSQQSFSHLARCDGYLCNEPPLALAENLALSWTRTRNTVLPHRSNINGPTHPIGPRAHCPGTESNNLALPRLIRVFSACLYFDIYAPNFEEVDGTYWFRVVRACVRPFIKNRAC